MQILFNSPHWKLFTQSECCISLYDRGSFFVGGAFERIVMRGTESPRHMSVGRFRAKDLKCLSRDTPCFLPWTFIEPECGDLIERWKCTHQILRTFQAEGFHTEKMHVRYSGNTSFWIAIPSGMMGNPVGRVEQQKTLRKRVFFPLIECPVDENLWDARHLMRLVGSIHERGSRVKAWTVGTFLNTGLGRLLELASEPMDDPARVSHDPLLLERCKAKMVFHVPPMDHVVRDLKGTGFVQEIENGVAEGSRNDAAFRYACFLLRRYAEITAFDTLLHWNMQNDPPLPEREVTQCFKSAKRTIQLA